MAQTPKNLYQQFKGAAYNPDNVLRSINAKLQNAAKQLGTDSELYGHYSTMIQSMLGMTGLIKKDATGTITGVSRAKSKIINNTKYSPQRLQAVLDYMNAHSVTSEKKRLTKYLQELWEEQANNPLYVGPQPKKKRKPTLTQIKSAAQHLNESQSKFEQILQYIYGHIVVQTVGGRSVAVGGDQLAMDAFNILARNNEKRTYGELREVVNKAKQLQLEYMRKQIPDNTPDILRSINAGSDVF